MNLQENNKTENLDGELSDFDGGVKKVVRYASKSTANKHWGKMSTEILQGHSRKHF